MNRAVALRIAACGIMGLGAALLIAALLLSTYTNGKIAKIPLNLDATLISRRHRNGLRSRRRSTPRSSSINRNVPLALQEQITVESPSNADVVTLQVGSTLRRTDKQQDERPVAGAGRHRHASTARPRTAVSSESNPGRRRAEAARHRRRPAADQHRAAARRADLPLPVRHREADLSGLRSDRPEGVRRQLRRRGRRQRADRPTGSARTSATTRTASWSSRSSTRPCSTTTPTPRSPRGRRCGVSPASPTSRSR